MRNFKPLLTIALGILIGTHVAFAVLQANEPGQWVEDRFLLKKGSIPAERVFVDEKNTVIEAIPDLSKAVDFPISPNYRMWSLKSYWHDGTLFTTASGNNEKSEDGTQFSRQVFAKWNEGKWHFIGDYKINPMEVFHVIPCNNDRFIVITYSKDLVDNNSPDRSPFHRMSVHPSKKEIRLDGSIPYSPMDDLRQYASNSRYFGLACSGWVMMTDEHATVINYDTGLYWIFSLEKASLLYSGMIFKELKPEQIISGGFPEAILCSHPEKGGTVLISAQEVSAFTTETGNEEKETNEMMNIPGTTWDDVKDVSQARREELAHRNPLLVWYRIYPNTGRVEKLADPPLGGEYLRDGGKNDYWRPMLDGSVKMGRIVFNEIVEKPELQPNEANDESKVKVNQGQSDSKQDVPVAKPPIEEDAVAVNQKAE